MSRPATHIVVRAGLATFPGAAEALLALFAGWHEEAASAPAGFALARPVLRVGYGASVLTIHPDPDVFPLELARVVEALEEVPPGIAVPRESPVVVWRAVFDGLDLDTDRTPPAEQVERIRPLVAVSGAVEVSGPPGTEDVCAWAVSRLPTGPAPITRPRPHPQTGVREGDVREIVVGGAFDPRDPGDVWAVHVVGHALVGTAGGGRIVVDPDPCAPRWFAVLPSRVSREAVLAELDALRSAPPAAEDVPEEIEMEDLGRLVSGLRTLSTRPDATAARRLAATCGVLFPASGPEA